MLLNHGEGRPLLTNEHPGVALKEDFLDPMGITPYRLAKSIGVTPIHVADILHGKRSITALTSLLLGRFFDMSPRFWLNMQTHYDMIEAERSNQARLEKVVKYADLKNEDRPQMAA